MKNKSYLKKESISSAEFKGKIIELIIGIIMLIAGAIICISTQLELGVASTIFLSVGAYLALCGFSGIIPYGIGALCEKGKYIAFDENELIVHSPKAKKCVTVSLTKIQTVKKYKGMSLDIMGQIFLNLSKAGMVIIKFTDDRGKNDAVIFGPINNVHAFVNALNQQLGKSNGK